MNIITDTNECVEGALSGSPPCPVGLICQNTDGSFTCDCPAGTMRNAQDECERMLLALHI